MPEINGFELYDKFKSKDPNIRTLFLTALGDVEAYNTTSNKVYPVMGERHFAKKPIRNGDLLEQVYSIMNWNTKKTKAVFADKQKTYETNRRNLIRQHWIKRQKNTKLLKHRG
jgi:FixJ family two-component response regulator